MNTRGQGKEIPPPPSANNDAPPVETIDIANVEGRVRDSLVKKVGRLVANNTVEALSVIRAWMNAKE
ncbi:MAG: hypothetical protein V3R66_04390 [Rhodospirillales bacterium]